MKLTGEMAFGYLSTFSKEGISLGLDLHGHLPSPRQEPMLHSALLVEDEKTNDNQLHGHMEYIAKQIGGSKICELRNTSINDFMHFFNKKTLTSLNRLWYMFHYMDLEK